MEEVNLSKRSIYKNFKLINEKLETLGVEGVRNIYGNGYYLGESSKQDLTELLKETRMGKEPTYSSEERAYLEYLLLFLNERVSIVQFIKQLRVSRKTIINDIKVLQSNLKKNDISITSTSRGHSLDGAEIHIRR